MQPHHHEPHTGNQGATLNWLRAAVLGADDGIVSVASIVAGVAGASNSVSFVLTAGIAGLAAGALSMAAGEYVSVSAQRDTEQALLEKERAELRDIPDEEFAELTGLYEAKGLTHATALQVATELTAHDAFAAHIDVELHIDPNLLVNPWQAALASAISFVVGGVIPLAAVALTPDSFRIVATFAAVIVALAITGTLSAYAGGAHKVRAALRVIVGGTIAMFVTYGIGHLVGSVGL